MTSGEISLKAMFQGMIPEQLNIISAKITSANPLKAVSLNNDKLQITSASLLVPEHLTRHTVKMSYWAGEDYHNNVNVVVDNSLRVGDVVYLLYLNKSSKFFVLGRRD